MSIYALATELITLKRTTRNVLNAVAPASSLDPDYQPASTSIMEVTLAGLTDPVGTVTINGTVNGGAESEVITTTTNRRYTTVKRFSALDATGGVTTSGLAGGTITVKAETEQTTDLHVGYPAGRATSTRGNWQDRLSGTHVQDRVTWLIPYTDLFTPRVGDRIVQENSGDTTDDVWEIKSVSTMPDYTRRTHWECQCVRRATT